MEIANSTAGPIDTWEIPYNCQRSISSVPLIISGLPFEIVLRMYHIGKRGVHLISQKAMEE